MTDQEAFALHMRTLFMDALNGESGLLRCAAEDTSEDATHPIHGNLRELYLRMASSLQVKLQRAKADIEAYVGGEERLREILIEDFEAGFWISPYQWLSEGHPWKISKEWP